MKTITLKLTNEEIDLIKNQKTDWVAFCNNEIKIGSEMYMKKNKLHINSSWVDELREFLNDEMFHYFQDFKTMADNEIKNLKSILSKLDKAVENKKRGGVKATFVNYEKNKKN